MCIRDSLWDGRRNQMRRLGDSGIFEIFMPGLGEGDLYKYEVKCQNGDPLLKADPYGNYSELRPHNASAVSYTHLDVYKRQVRSFWNEEKGCLRDVISGTKADEQIRCNQIWAVSMPFSLLDEEKERRVVDTVFEKLYTPYGLRTLEMEDGEFVGSYGGKQFKRDLAYHQGTVWVFPLGAYYLAYLKVNKKSREAVATVRGQLTALESALREGCIGQLPEIYDGANPTVSRGCFAQAWSVGELLRVFAELEELDKEEQ